MIVLVAFVGEYEQRGITGIYTSMEEAEKDFHPRGGQCRGGHDIETWPITGLPDQVWSADLNSDDQRHQQNVEQAEWGQRHDERMDAERRRE